MPRITTAARLVAIAIALPVALTGCGDDVETPSGGTSPSSASSPPTATPTPTPTATPTPTTELEGSWQAGPLSLEETEATVRRHGLGRHLAAYRKNAPFSDDTLLTLTIENGAWDLYGESNGGPPQPIDYDAEYEIEGDTVVFHHSDGSNTYRWSVDGDTLRLEFVRSTLPGYEGIPDEVFQRALYMTSVFTRQS